MPHYFFNLENGDERYLDEVGCFAADECEALSALVDVLAEYREASMSPGVLSGLNVSIVDTTGRTVVRLTM
mgnify:CR=1 FL=1